MKIAFFIDEFPTYSETFIVNQIIGLIALGFDVSIISTKINRKIPLKSVEEHQLLEKVIVLPNTHGLGVKATLLTIRDTLLSLPCPKLRSYLFEDIRHRKGGAQKLAVLIRNKAHYSFDAIIAHFGPNAVTAMRMKELGLLSGKIHAVFHGYDMSKSYFLRKYMPAYKALFATDMLALPVSHYWESKLLEFGCPREKIVVNRMGVDIELYSFTPKKPDNTAISILTVARHTEKKGIEYAIKAMANLKAKNILFDYKIAGIGPLFEHHQKLIDSLSLSHEITLLGVKDQDEINLLLEASDVFLLPSVTSSEGDKEGIPVSLMEAMAKGVICLSTFHSGIPELISDNESGFLVPEKDANAISEKIEQILKSDIRPIQTAARKKVEDEFAQSSAYQQLSNILLKQQCNE